MAVSALEPHDGELELHLFTVDDPRLWEFRASLTPEEFTIPGLSDDEWETWSRRRGRSREVTGEPRARKSTTGLEGSFGEMGDWPGASDGGIHCRGCSVQRQKCGKRRTAPIWAAACVRGPGA